ncbi:hypothetical protein EBZ80_15995 [bacterium]|nr:hypothetical protein [bacterium]
MNSHSHSHLHPHSHHSARSVAGWIVLFVVALLTALYAWTFSTHRRALSPFPACPYFVHKSWRQGKIGPGLYQTLTRRVTHARAAAAQQRCVVAMLMRNHGHQIIPVWRAQWEPVLRTFADYRIVIVENDSMDHTRTLLLQWAREDERVSILCPDGTVNSSTCRLGVYTTPFQRTSPHPQKDTSDRRIELLASFRNAYLQHIYDAFADFDYLLVCDPDLQGERYEPGFWHAVLTLQTTPHLWGVSSYTLTPDGRPFDPFSYVAPHASPVSMTVSQKEQRDNSLTQQIRTRMAGAVTNVPVASAFFGSCLYRLGPLVTYRPLYLFLPNAWVCEHATFHAQFPPRTMVMDPFWIMMLQKNLY